MPAAAADDLYWSPLDMDAGDSPSYGKQYIDPWDLENYAYIRQHLDHSVESEADAAETPEAQESLYYAPGARMSILPLVEEDVYGYNEPRRGRIIYSNATPMADYWNSTRRSSRYDRPASTYAAVEDYHPHLSRRHSGCVPRATMRQRFRIDEDIYDVQECNDADLYGIAEHGSLQIYEKNKTMRRVNARQHKPEGPVAKMAKSRSHSFSTADYQYDPYKLNHPSYNEIACNLRSDIYDSNGSSPIYDDIHSGHLHFKPRHFRLSNYGHLKIDYSFSWSNLNKYIYN